MAAAHTDSETGSNSDLLCGVSRRKPERDDFHFLTSRRPDVLGAIPVVVLLLLPTLSSFSLFMWDKIPCPSHFVQNGSANL